MLHKIKKFSKLSKKERKLFLEAYMILGMVRTVILTVSFKRIVKALDHHLEAKELIHLSEAEMKVAKQVGKAIVRASAHTPWESTCLAQSLTAQKMLQKRGIAGVFYLGAMKDTEKKDSMKVHAWSQCGESIITGAGGHEAFTVLSMFAWKSKNDNP